MPRIEDVPLDSVEWDPKKRLRQKIPQAQYDTLKATIAANGQDVPIIVWQDPATGRIEGIAGFTRWRILSELGCPSVRAEFRDEPDPLKRRAIEFRENNNRNEFTWDDSVSALATQHHMHRADDPRWSQAQTASEMGVGQPHVSKCLDLYEYRDNPEVWGQRTFDEALNKMKHLKEIERANWLNAEAEAERQPEAVEVTSAGTAALCVTHITPQLRKIHTDHSIINKDFHEWGGLL